MTNPSVVERPARVAVAAPSFGISLRLPTSRQFLAVAVGLALLHASGLAGDAALLVLSATTPTLIGLAVRTYKPRPAWPWLTLICAGLVWSAAGAIRAASGSTGDLSAERSLLPDVPAVIGYGLFAIALLGMLRAQGHRTRSRTLLLDGAILAGSTMLLCWVGLIAPVLSLEDAAPVAKMAIVLYPPISVFLVTIAARLAFGGATSGRAHRLLLTGMMFVLLGDAAYVPLETRVFDDVPGNLLELPYAMAYALIGAAGLHPTMRDTVRSQFTAVKPAQTRFALIALALLTPALILLVWSPSSAVERLIVGGLAVVLGFAAVARVVLAAHSQAEVEARLSHQATHDELTGLPNRPAIRDALERLIDDAATAGDPVSVLFVDLDRFKLVNDSHGHVIGDQLLLLAADRMREVVGVEHEVARLSGDEFLVVSRGLSDTAAVELAQRIRDSFTEPFELIGTMYLTASIGVSVAHRASHDVDATSLIRDADTAMYEAKAAGRSAVALFDPAMRARTEHQMETYNGLRAALERDEFEVHYQVIVDPATGLVQGVEALVRWRSPEGLVPPDRFIPIAEESGLIAPIGEVVLREACAQLARWRQLGCCSHLTVSVNVSARQLIDVDMVAVVADALEESGLPADALWLEITESVMMTDTLDTLASLSGLRTLGVHLSVDDFGTGYSSLSYLQRYPIEQVKIDRQFVRGLLDGAGDAAVVAAIVGIAEALGLSLVAEGVEEEAQAARLLELGCELVQGFLYARPMPALDVGPILLQRNEAAQPPTSGRWRA